MNDKGNKVSGDGVRDLRSVVRDFHSKPQNISALRNPQGTQNVWPSHTDVVRIGAEIETTVIEGSSWRFYAGYWSRFNPAGGWFDADPIFVIEAMNRDLTENDYYADGRFVAQVNVTGTIYPIFAVDVEDSAGSLTVRRADNSDSVSPVSVLEVGPDGAWDLTGTGAECGIILQNASTSNVGIISLASQGFAGTKIFQDGVVSYGDSFGYSFTDYVSADVFSVSAGLTNDAVGLGYQASVICLHDDPTQAYVIVGVIPSPSGADTLLWRPALDSYGTIRVITGAGPTIFRMSTTNSPGGKLELIDGGTIVSQVGLNGNGGIVGLNTGSYAHVFNPTASAAGNGLKWTGYSESAADPTTADIPGGHVGIHRNTSSGFYYLAYNIGASIKRVTLV